LTSHIIAFSRYRALRDFALGDAPVPPGNTGLNVSAHIDKSKFFDKYLKGGIRVERKRNGYWKEERKVKRITKERRFKK